MIPAERIIEVAIGMHDDSNVTLGQRPPVLAREIVERLQGAGYEIIHLRNHALHEAVFYFQTQHVMPPGTITAYAEKFEEYLGGSK